MKRLIVLALLLMSSTILNAATLQNLGNSNFKGYFLDIDGNNGNVILSGSSSPSGVNWKINNLGNGVYSLQNLGNSSSRRVYKRSVIHQKKQKNRGKKMNGA